MILGSIGSMITGVSLPIFNILFGQMLDSLNKKGVGGYQDAVNQVCISFVIVAAANVVAGTMQVYFWSAAGERQTQRFREKYVRSILSQEIGWFDTCGASELSTKVADLTGKVQDGLGRKAADLIQYFTQLVASYAVGFYLSWKLTVVLIASFPIIAGAGAFMINAVTAAQNESSGNEHLSIIVFWFCSWFTTIYNITYHPFFKLSSSLSAFIITTIITLSINNSPLSWFIPHL